MSVRLKKRSCSTRVSPNCGEARGFASPRTQHQQHRPSPVSGATPETTRETRVLQLRIGSLRYA